MVRVGLQASRARRSSIYVCILSCVGAATTLVILMDTSRGTTEVRYLDGLKLYRDRGPCPTRFITIEGTVNQTHCILVV